MRLKNTFNTWDEDSLNPINDENYFDEESDDVIIPNNQSMTRAAAHRDITRKDIEKFPTVGAVNVHIKDKILRFAPTRPKTIEGVPLMNLANWCIIVTPTLKNANNITSTTFIIQHITALRNSMIRSNIALRDFIKP